MSINAIKIDQLFKTELDGTMHAVRVGALVAMAVSAIVPIPPQPVETTGDLRQYFLENAAVAQNVIDDIREVTVFNVDNVLSNAYVLWSTRYAMVFNPSGDVIRYYGSTYNSALDSMMPTGVTMADAKLDGATLNTVIDYIRKAAAITPAVIEE